MKYTLVFLFFTVHILAQNDSINLLDEVKLLGNFSSKNNTGFQITILHDSVINIQQQSLGNLLQQKANFYFKQHGNGMVSSIALRGSNASHTAVYWNGISVNSMLNGQTDFNTLSANSYNQIEIRKGAGSTLFGSGAIGGAINLRDKTYFKEKNEFLFRAGIGSYNSQDYFYQLRSSTKKLYAKIALQESKSKNNYPFLNTDLYNENGAYKNLHLKGVFGHQIDKNNQLEFIVAHSINHREFSRTLTAPSNSKYKNIDSKFLLQWKNFASKYNSNLKLAIINETYNYYFNKEDLDFSFGKSSNYIAKYDVNYLFSQKFRINTGVENRFTQGVGTNILNKERNTFESYISFHHQLNTKWKYNAIARKGFTSRYEIPLIYTLGANYKINSKINLNGNLSTNYKLPTFNDLYWQRSGNENLESEKNRSAEIGMNYHQKNKHYTINSYYTKSKDLIQWRPRNNGFWQPINIQNVSTYGLEFTGKFHKKINQYSIDMQIQYDLSISTDDTLKKQLIYVPYHKANMTLNYQYKTWHINYNQLYNGSVFTTTSNTQIVESFSIANFSINKTLSNEIINIGFSIYNLYNKSYQVVAYRPMPNRNYKLNINIKI